MAVQLVVKWLDLVPQPGRFGPEFVRAHVEAGAPHLAQVVVAECRGALVGELDVTLELVAHRHGNLAPARPQLEQLIVVANFLHHEFELRA